MKILALDTATENCSAALLIDGQLRSRVQLLTRGHAEQILVMVDALMREAQLGLRDLTAIAFGRGPGAFTGVRLAASVTQGLAFGAGLPVVPVSDLRALAQQVFDLEPQAERVLACSDARMQEVYFGCFECGADRLALARGEEQVGRAARVRPSELWSGPYHAVGSGFTAYPALREHLGADIRRLYEGLLPRAEEVARLAVPEVLAGRVLPAEQALPVYVRDEVAHVSPAGH